MAGSRRDARKDFAKFDTDGNGTLDFDEFCGLVKAREPGEHSEAELRQRFNELDEDKSGTVEAREYICFSIIESLTNSRIRLIDLLDRFDSDRNRKVSRVEFRKTVKMLGFDAGVEFVDMVFDALDEDASGEVDYKELATALRPSTIARNKHALRRVSAGRRNRLGALAKLKADSSESVQSQLRRILHDNRVRVIDLFHDWDIDSDGHVTVKEVSEESAPAYLFQSNALLSRGHNRPAMAALSLEPCWSQFREAIRTLGFDAERKDIEALFSFLDR